MPPKGPVVIANKNNNAKGVLPVNTAAAHHAPPAPAKSTVRLKLQVRRLPPSLTKDEFLDAFGDEWKPMAGKVDWLEYRPGKVKKSANVSEQSRAYVHLTSDAHIKPFEAKFLSLTFQDAKGSHKDPTLKHLQPTLEYAPNQRIPAAKQRVDGRQGTIDQDTEFITFLERETQPVTKPASLEAVAAAAAAAAEKTHEKVSSTPLLDDLREKKANKAKAASSKPTKGGRGDHKEDKVPDKTNTRGADAEHPSKSAKAAAKSSQPAKEAVKAGNKQSNKANAATAAASQPSPATAKSQQQSPASPAPARKQRDRGTTNAIKSLLQRDLGLAPAGKRGAKAAAAATVTATASPAAAPATATPPAPATTEAAPPTKAESTPKPAKASRTRKGNSAEKTNGQNPSQENTNAKSTPSVPSGILKKPAATQPAPKSAKAKANAQNTATQPPASPSTVQTPPPSKSAKSAPQPAVGAVKAYLKHANASQGITEPLITAALSAFGPIVKVDIDKRKGTALAEFKNHDGLKAAMAKRSIPVAQGAVEVLEFRERPATSGGRNPPATTARGGGSVRGKGRSGRGASASNSTAASNATPASPAPASTPTSAPADAT